MEIRKLNENDSLEELTSLIHRAYRQLADQGFRYWGTHQTVEDTKKRISNGECYVAVDEGKLIGTILMRRPDERSTYHPWYNRPDVATFHQFAVNPNRQKEGIGSKLLDWVETRAVKLAATEMACDTAEGAKHLIQLYLKRGYRQVDTADWDLTNYKSIILSKQLGSS